MAAPLIRARGALAANCSRHQVLRRTHTQCYVDHTQVGLIARSWDAHLPVGNEISTNLSRQVRQAMLVG